MTANLSLSQTDVHQLWQNQLLSTMGISRWVSQHSPVIETAGFDIFHDLPKPTIVEPIIQPTIEPIIIEPIIQPIEQLTNVEQPPVLPDYYLFDDDNNFQKSPVVDEPIVKQQIIVEPFQLQVMTVYQWILLADSKILSVNPEQSYLWQNIAHSLNGYLQLFDFPFVRQQEQIADKYIEQMSDIWLALASFQGLICKIQLQSQNRYQVGAVTPLPDCLTNEKIQHLPYLSQILQDNQQKRQLWTRIQEVVL